MKKKIKITASQKDKLNEISVVADTGSTGGNVTQAVTNAQKDAKQSGVRNASVVVPPTTESILSNKKLTEHIVTKRDLENLRMEHIKKTCKRYKKGELNEILLKAHPLTESYKDLRDLGLFEVADAIVSTKEQFSGLVYKLFDTLYQKGYKFKDIVSIVDNLNLNGIIPKTTINKIGQGYKTQEQNQKEQLKQQQSQPKQTQSQVNKPNNVQQQA